MTAKAEISSADNEGHGDELVDGQLKPMDRVRFEAFVQEGIDSAERDGWIPHEVVVQRLREQIAARKAACAA